MSHSRRIARVGSGKVLRNTYGVHEAHRFAVLRSARYHHYLLRNRTTAWRCLHLHLQVLLLILRHEVRPEDGGGPVCRGYWLEAGALILQSSQLTSGREAEEDEEALPARTADGEEAASAAPLF